MKEYPRKDGNATKTGWTDMNKLFFKIILAATHSSNWQRNTLSREETSQFRKQGVEIIDNSSSVHQRLQTMHLVCTTEVRPTQTQSSNGEKYGEITEEIALSSTLGRETGSLKYNNVKKGSLQFQNQTKMPVTTMIVMIF